MMCRLYNISKREFISRGIVDGGADTTVIGEGWEIEHYTMRKAIVVGFDEKASKGGLPIVSGRTVTKLKSGEEVIIWVHEVVYNNTTGNEKSH